MLFLCTDAGNYITGQELVIDGGMTAGGRPRPGRCNSRHGREAAARGWIVVAAASGAISVIVGAFAAHGLDLRSGSRASRRSDWLQTGSHYRDGSCARDARRGAPFRAACWPAQRRASPSLALWLFLAGSVLFPGALYALALGGPRWFGAVAPIGGTAFILGWLCLALAAMRKHATD